MQVNVKLYGLAQRMFPEVSPEAGKDVELPPGSILLDLIRELGIKSRSGIFLSVNGELGRWDTELKAGDRVEIRIIMTGG
jgi:sulfur carrier protein ThiS